MSLTWSAGMCSGVGLLALGARRAPRWSSATTSDRSSLMNVEPRMMQQPADERGRDA